MKKIICYALSLVMLLAVMAVPAMASTTTAGYSADLVTTADLSAVPNITALVDGTVSYDPLEEQAWQITDGAGLKAFSDYVNANPTLNFKGKTVYLAADINMQGITDFAPIGNTVSSAGAGQAPAAPHFCGTFDGQGHKISNLVMTSNADGAVNVALFGAVVHGTIRNLIIDETCSFTYDGTSMEARVAAVVALAHSHSGYANSAEKDANSAFDRSYSIINVQNKANVTSTAYAGGIVCTMTANTNYTPLIKNCSNSGAVKGDLGAGGIIGNMLNRHLTLESCENTGDVTAVYGGAAGILMNGDIVSTNPSVVIKNCTASGTVKGVTGENKVDGIAVLGTKASADNNTKLVQEGNTSTATLQQADPPEHKPFDTVALDYGNTVIGYDPSKVTTKKDLTDVLPICTFLNSGDATEFKICTPADLATFADFVNKGADFYGFTIYLANDIDMTGVEMDPIGYSYVKGYWDSDARNNGVANEINRVPQFGGTFDGQGYVIDNLKIEKTFDGTENYKDEYTAIGLFGMIRSATIKNVVLGSGCSFSYEGNVGAYMGAIVGLCHRRADNINMEAHSIIENCYSAATVTGPRSTAGIVGAVDSNHNGAQGAEIKNCTNAGNITADEYAGGIVGYIIGRKLSILNCRNVGTITLTLTAEQQASGVAGQSYSGAAGICARPNSTNPVKINQCINNGKIVGPDILGGIVAIENSATVGITYCTNTGAIEASTGAQNVGPLFGLNMSNTEQQMKNNADLTGQNDVTYTAYTVTTNFPTNYAEMDAAHEQLNEQLYKEQNPDEEDNTSDNTDDTTAAPDVTTEAPAQTTAAPTTAKKGCGSAVTGAFALVMLVGTAGAFLAKKKD